MDYLFVFNPSRKNNPKPKRPHPLKARQLLPGLDPYRRFEVAYPDLGKELHRILDLETPAAARELLLLARRELQHRVEDLPLEAFQVVMGFAKG